MNDYHIAEPNLYTPPKAQIADPVQEAAPEFYIVSRSKLLILFYATLGAYTLYWFWRNWKLHKIRRKLDLWPVARAIFSIFFAHSLNREIEYRVSRGGHRHDWSPNAWATVYVVSTIAGNILDRLSTMGIGWPAVDIASLLFLLPTGYALVRSQVAANIACDDPEATQNRHLTMANYVWIVLGLMLWALLLLGLGMPPEETAA
jgi:hypothetical protein